MTLIIDGWSERDGIITASNETPWLPSFSLISLKTKGTSASEHLNGCLRNTVVGVCVGGVVLFCFVNKNVAPCLRAAAALIPAQLSQLSVDKAAVLLLGR